MRMLLSCRSPIVQSKRQYSFLLGSLMIQSRCPWDTVVGAVAGLVKELARMRTAFVRLEANGLQTESPSSGRANVIDCRSLKIITAWKAEISCQCCRFQKSLTNMRSCL